MPRSLKLKKLTPHTSQSEHRDGRDEDETDQWYYKSKVQLWVERCTGAECRVRLEERTEMQRKKSE